MPAPAMVFANQRPYALTVLPAIINQAGIDGSEGGGEWHRGQ